MEQTPPKCFLCKVQTKFEEFLSQACLCCSKSNSTENLCEKDSGKSTLGTQVEIQDIGHNVDVEDYILDYDFVDYTKFYDKEIEATREISTDDNDAYSQKKLKNDLSKIMGKLEKLPEKDTKLFQDLQATLNSTIESITDNDTANEIQDAKVSKESKEIGVQTYQMSYTTGECRMILGLGFTGLNHLKRNQVLPAMMNFASIAGYNIGSKDNVLTIFYSAVHVTLVLKDEEMDKFYEAAKDIEVTARELMPTNTPNDDNKVKVTRMLTRLYMGSLMPFVDLRRLPSILSAAGPSTSAAPAPMQRTYTYIWSGVLEWMEKGKVPGDQQKVTKLLPCQVSANSKDIEPELKVDTWPNKLLMQLMPKQLISNIGGQYLKDSKSVLFHLHPNEALDALTKVMVNGYAGCVHFSSPPQCDIKVLILLYTPDKKAYLGFIPNNQATFVDRLRKVIQQQKITQIINKQMPAGAAPTMAPTMPTSTMTGGTGAMQTPGISSGGMGNSGMGGSGMSGGMGQVGQMAPGAVGQVGQVVPGGSAGMGQQQVQHNPQGMMMGGGMGVGGKGPRGGAQLDGLEAARQQNLEKIQHLQQTLEAAHQQEAQFKSQMDIMSHLQIAQQQELNYKQMEEQRKHQLQQQLQQQLRAGGVGQVGVGQVGVGQVGVGQVGVGQVGQVGAGAHPRLMGRMLPANPGLRHLLQQQPQYRPGGGAPRPSAPGQQFDDVNNYDFL